MCPPTGGHPHFRDKESAIMIAATTRLQKSREISARKGSLSVTFANFSVARKINTSPPPYPPGRARAILCTFVA